jgi:hypothetical protein
MLIYNGLRIEKVLSRGEFVERLDRYTNTYYDDGKTFKESKALNLQRYFSWRMGTLLIDAKIVCSREAAMQAASGDNISFKAWLTQVSDANSLILQGLALFTTMDMGEELVEVTKKLVKYWHPVDNDKFYEYLPVFN